MAPGDFMGCGYYRMIVPFGELKRRGNDVWFVDDKHDQHIWGNTAPLISGVQINRADVLVIQRQYDIELAKYVQVLQQRGTKVIYEIDDAFHFIPRSNPNFAELTKRNTNIAGAQAIMSVCDGVIVSTPQLYEEYRKYNENIWVCYNAIDDRQFARTDITLPKITGAPKREGQLRIGWAGSDTHVDDLMLALPSVAKFMEEDSRVRFVCAGHDVRGLMPVSLRKRCEYAGSSHSRDKFSAVDWQSDRLPSIGYYDLLRSADFDIAIAPVERNRFNASKSYLKVMEYAMLGIPSIASNHSPYRQWRDENPGTTILCDADHKQWLRALRSMDEPMRAKMGKVAWRSVLDRNLISEKVSQWQAALQSVGALLNPLDHGILRW